MKCQKKFNVNEVTEEELNVNARKLREACEKFQLQGKNQSFIVKT